MTTGVTDASDVNSTDFNKNGEISYQTKKKLYQIILGLVAIILQERKMN
jgi:hypothetical protein